MYFFRVVNPSVVLIACCFFLSLWSNAGVLSKHLSTDPQVIVLLGPPGAGKGTQAALLSKKFGIPHISTGDVLRAERTSGSEIGMKLEEYIQAGALVPEHLLRGVIENRLRKEDCKNGFILDGDPRRIQDVSGTNELLGKLGLEISAVVHLPVGDDVIKERLTSRRICSKTGCSGNYNLITLAPQVSVQCDLCGSSLIRRQDDQLSIIERRLQNYHRDTEPLVDYFQSKDLLITVPGTGNLSEIASSLEKAVSEKKEERLFLKLKESSFLDDQWSRPFLEQQTLIPLENVNTEIAKNFDQIVETISSFRHQSEEASSGIKLDTIFVAKNSAIEKENYTFIATYKSDITNGQRKNSWVRMSAFSLIKNDKSEWPSDLEYVGSRP